MRLTSEGHDQRHYPIIDDIRIDINAIRVLQHRCNPAKCTQARACCNAYEVLVDRGEMSRAAGALPDAAKYLEVHPDTIDPFDETEGGHCLNTDENGLCVFAYRGKKDGGIRCSLHSAALDLNISPAKLKPTACTLWPLFLDQTDPPLLTVQTDATTFPCNTLRTTARGLDPGIQQIIETIFGKPFLKNLLDLL